MGSNTVEGVVFSGSGAHALLFPVDIDETLGSLAPPLTKSAQVTRVLLARWMTKDRLPKNAGSSSFRDRYLSTYSAVNGSLSILPYLPARSPTWQLGRLPASQGGLSPRSVGSRCGPAAVQLPPAALLRCI